MRETNSERARFFRGLALLLHSGIGPAEGMYLLAEDLPAQTRQPLRDMSSRMEQGAAFSDVMEDGFSAYDVAMIRAGEETGRLEEALDALAAHYEEREQTARAIRGALAYPSMVLLLMLVVIGVLLIKVLPIFDSVYTSLGSGLTGIAGGLLRLGELLQSALPVLLVLLVIGAVGVALFSLWTPFREKLTALWRSHFGDRGIYRKFNNARFARGLAMGLRSGMPVEEAMVLAAGLLAETPAAAARCDACIRALKNGADLPEAMGAGALLTPAMGRLLAVGLRSGNGDRVMTEIAEKMMEQARQALEERIAAVEPAMVTGASLLVGLILLAVMLPLMNIMSTIG